MDRMTRHFLLLPVGSSGDVNPFLGIGAALQARGHAVHLLTNEKFLPDAARLGLSAEAIMTAAEFDSALQHPELWTAKGGPKVVLTHPMAGRTMRVHYERCVDFWQQHPEGIVVAGVLAMGARVAREKFRGRLATIQLQPFSLWSVEQPPVMPIGPLPKWAPRWSIRLLYWYADTFHLKKLLHDTVLKLRQELQLPTLRGNMMSWLNSPDRIVMTTPSWYASPSDWPAHLRQTDFPICDGAATEIAPEISGWLAAGPPPLVCTLGTAMVQAHRVYQAVCDAAAMNQQRLLILTKVADQVPAVLPEGIRRFDFAPLSKLLPKCAGTIHHGGIGTTSRALASGQPQLILSFGFDQNDNGGHVQELGCGSYLPAPRVTVDRLRPLLKQLTESDKWKTQARAVASRCTDQGLTEIASLLEETPLAE
jgi:rhamnosyltransferase subunit B